MHGRGHQRTLQGYALVVMQEKRGRLTEFLGDGQIGEKSARASPTNYGRHIIPS